MLNARKLAAIDLVFLGSRVIITEFVAGVLFSIALGVFALLRARGSAAQIALGLYLISLGINYVPLLVCAISIARSGNAHAELGGELDNQRAAMARYRRQSLWLLVPLIVPLAVITQSRKSHVNDPRVG